MIDQIVLSPVVHVAVGAAVLLTTLISLFVTGILAWRNERLSTGAHGTLIVAQIVLMVQALVGIKLLDQGLGPLQLYIHYLGGLGPLFFFLLYYWLPRHLRERRWTTVAVSGSAFLFTLMAFSIGASYVAGGI